VRSTGRHDGPGRGALGGGSPPPPSSTEGRFRLGEIVEALRRQLPPAADLLDRLAIDLEVDWNTITEAWFVAAAFPPTTRRSGLPWTVYLILRFHPQRHELVDRAASAGWD